MITERLFDADLVINMSRQIYVKTFKQPPPKVVLCEMIKLGSYKLMNGRSAKQTDNFLTRF